MTKAFYSLVERIGAGVRQDLEPASLKCRQESLKHIEDILKDKGVSKEDILVLMHVGTSKNFSLRRWPSQYFAKLSDKLIEAFKVKVIFSGTKEEAGLSKEVMGYMTNKESALDLSGRLDFDAFICLAGLSDLLISADTAPVHIGSSLAKPVVGLYGPNTPHLYGPWNSASIYFYKDIYCSPCITNYNAKINICRNPEGKGICMRKITPDEVFLGIEKKYFQKESPQRLKKLS
jgi:ADP-heptose:LPS heptosyltransferase